MFAMTHQDPPRDVYNQCELWDIVEEMGEDNPPSIQFEKRSFGSFFKPGNGNSLT